jgi:hypothetical protein
MTDTLLCRTDDEPRHVYSATTAGTIAPRRILPQRVHKTLTEAMTRQALEDGVACKPSVRSKWLEGGE